MQRGFNCFCEGLEYALSRWWGVALFLASLAAAFAKWGWDGLDRWIYIVGVLLVVFLIGNTRRSDKAMHIKLDEIDPRADHNALERRDEREMRPLNASNIEH